MVHCCVCGKKGLGDGGKVVEGEHDIQRSKTGVIWKGSDTSRGLWFGDVIIKRIGKKKNRSIGDDVFEEHMWHKESGQSEERNDKRKVRV